MPLRCVASFDWATLAGVATGNTGNRVADSSAGTPGVNTTARTGTHSLELTLAGAAERLIWDTNTIGASQTRLNRQVAIRWISGVPTTQIINQVTLAAGLAVVLYTNASDQLVCAFEGGNEQIGPTLSADTWYVVEIYVDVSANPNTVRWWVNKTEQTQVSQGQSATTISSDALGSSNNETWANTLLCDDYVLITDTSAITVPMGNHKVVMLKPDTGGTTAEIGTANATARMVTNSAVDSTHNSANILTALSEVPPTLGATASGIGQRTSGTGNACGIPMTTYTLASGESFVGMRILGCGWAASTTAASMGLRSFNGTTEATLFTAADPNFDNSTTTPAWLCKMTTAGHFDTQTEVDALVVRVGYSSDVNPLIGFHAIYADTLVKESTGVTGAAVGDFGGLGTGNGNPNVVGSAVGSFGGLGTANGNPRRLGTAVGSFGGLGVANGAPRLLGTAVGSFGGLGVATGNPRSVGAAVGDFGGLGTATGTPTPPATTGSGVGDFGGLGTSTGLPTVHGAAVGDFGGLGTSTGTRSVAGQAVGSFGGLGVATGNPRSVGAAVGSFGGLGVAVGNPRSLGSAIGGFGGFGVATGVGQSIGEGTGTGDFGGLGSATGVVTRYGSAVGLFGFSGVATGTPRSVGAAAGPWGGLGASTGVARVVGAAIGDWGFLAVAVIPPDAIPGHGFAYVGKPARKAYAGAVAGSAYVDQLPGKVTAE